MDSTTAKNLELVFNLRDYKSEDNLFDTLNFTKTPPGGLSSCKSRDVPGSPSTLQFDSAVSTYPRNFNSPCVGIRVVVSFKCLTHLI